METIGEIIPFAKEMLNQRPSKGMLRIYMLGSALTILTVVSGLVDMLLLPFGEQETAEDTPAELITERTPDWNTALVLPAVTDKLETAVVEVKDTHLITGQRSSTNRLHAS